jgi:hypothetical protein
MGTMSRRCTEEGELTSVSCLPELITAIDAAEVAPRTREEAERWANEWRERETNLIAAKMITPECVLAIVRSQPYRLRRQARHARFSTRDFAVMQAEFLSAGVDASLKELGRKLAVVLKCEPDVIAGAIARRREQWLAERRTDVLA